MAATVGLVLVSHSQRLAEGTVEVAEQMAPGVVILPAGGVEDGGLGTSFDRVERAVVRALAECRSVAVLADLGSAVLTVESVIEMLDDDATRVRWADAPFVEGAVAAAVTAHGGGDLDDVVGSAEHAGSTFAGSGGTAGPPAVPAHTGAGATTATAALRNPLGLHARPAALLARMIAGRPGAVTVDGVNGASVLELMKLGAAQGHVLTVAGTGPDAAATVRAVVEAIESGLGEL